MKKQTKKIIKIMFVLFLFAMISTNVFAGTVTLDNKTHDYSEISSLPSEYSYGTLFFTDKTELTTLGNASYSTITSTKKFIYGAKVGETISFKLTNCSIDKDGDMCDVVFVVDNVKAFKKKPGSNNMGVQWGEASDAEAKCRITLAVGQYAGSQLIHFWFSSNLANANYSMTYYKSGTNTLANVPYVVSTLYDIDVSTASDAGYSGEMFDGNEGTKMPDGVIYYQKKGSDKYLRDIPDGGLGVCTPANSPYDKVSYDGILKSSSAVVIEKTPDSKFDLTYSGSSCGIAYVFISPYVYELDAPTQTVSKSEVMEKEKFTYTISQYIPNNYYSNVLNFINNEKGKYQEFVITDQLDPSLVVDGNIVVKNEENKDVTSYFNITVGEDNKITVTVKDEYFNKKELYSHKYSIEVPVYVEEGTGLTDDDGIITNIASTKVKYSNSTETENFSTEQVKIKLEYNVSVDSKIDNGVTFVEDGTEDSTLKVEDRIDFMDKSDKEVSFKLDYGYELDKIIIDGQEVDIDSLPEDIFKEENGVYSYIFVDENIQNNIEHTIEVKTKLKETSVEINYVDEEGNKITDSVIINGKVFDDYNAELKEVYGYKCDELPKNIKGTMEEEKIIVNFVYNKKDAKVVVKYLDDFLNEIIPPVEITGKVFDEYETELKSFDGYQLSRKPERTKGEMTEEVIEVMYVYTDISKYVPGAMPEGSLSGSVLNTGDGSHLFMYVAMLVASIVAGCALIIIKKKSK